MINLITRNDFERHVMLKSLCLQLEQDGHTLIKDGLFLKVFKFRIYTSKKSIFIADDPLAFLAGLLIFRKVKRSVFWMLELNMYQKKVRDFRGILRFLLFWVSTWFSFLLASKIIFPSHLRKNFICDLFSHLRIVNKSTVILNVPKISQNDHTISRKIESKVSAIVRNYEKVAVYAGTMYEGRDLEQIICDSRRMDLALILCGSMTSERLAEKISSQEHVFYLGNLNVADLSYVYRNVCVGYVNYSDEILNTKYCAPVKIWEYQRSGLYIFSNHNFAMKHEWSNLVDYFYDVSGSIPCSIIKENIFSKSPEGRSIRIEENLLSNVFAD